ATRHPMPQGADHTGADREALLVLYGGTFDPVHHGHLATACAARDMLGGPVHFMPAADPPHRAPPGADASRRAAMLALAIADEPEFHIDLRELRREGPSYSVDTLRALRGELGATVPVALLVGADSLLALPEWHDWRALFGLAHFVVAERPGSGLDRSLPPELAAATAGRWSDDPEALRPEPPRRPLRPRQPPPPAPAPPPGFGQPGAGGHRRRRLLAGTGAARRRRLHRAPPAVRRARGPDAVPGIIARQPPEPAPLSSSAHVIKTRLPNPPPAAEV